MPRELRSPSPARTRSAHDVPAWFARGLVGLTLVVVTCGGIGLFLADRGGFSLPASVIPGLVGAVVLLALVWRPLGTAALGRSAAAVTDRPTGAHEAADEPTGAHAATERTATGGSTDGAPDHGPAQLPAVVIVVVGLVSVVVQAMYAGKWLTTDRDPGVYATTAMWLARNSGLALPVAGEWRGTGIAVTGASSGVFDDDGTLEFQFSHLLPVLMAQAARAVGDRGAFVVNAVIAGVALCAIYAVACRLFGRPWLALASAVAMGVGVPWLYVIRSSLSEPVMLLLVWVGLWLLTAAWDRRSLLLMVLAGLVLSAGFMARVDALFYVAALPILAGIVSAVVGRDDRRFLLKALPAFLLGAVPSVGAGLLDLLTRTGTYIADQASQFRSLAALAAASCVAGVVAVVIGLVLRRRAGLAERVVARTRWVPLTVAWFVGAVLVLAWTVRPYLQDSRTPIGNALIAALQRRESVPVDGALLYNENSMVWLSWYIGGPLLALGVIGIALLCRQGLKGNSAAVAFLSVLGLGTAVYLYQVSASPDQPWATRRFVVAAFPMFIVAGMYTVGVLVDRLAGVRPRVRRGTAIGVAVLLCLFAAVPSIPVRGYHPRAGYLAAFQSACDTLGPDAVVLVPPKGIAALIAEAPLRSVCDVPVVAPIDVPTEAQLQQAKQVWAERGKQLWVVDTGPALGSFPGIGQPQLLGASSDTLMVITRLTRPPDRLEAEQLALYGAKVI